MEACPSEARIVAYGARTAARQRVVPWGWHEHPVWCATLKLNLPTAHGPFGPQ